MSNKVTKAELAEYKKNKEIATEYSNGEITVFWNCLLYTSDAADE